MDISNFEKTSFHQLISYIDLKPENFNIWLNPALNIYFETMNYDQKLYPTFIQLWIKQLNNYNWQGKAAMLNHQMIGFATGFTGEESQWWHKQVAMECRKRNISTKLLSKYFLLTELHVTLAAQGNQTGYNLIKKILLKRTENYALLSTLEVPYEKNRAWNLYRRLGFKDYLRYFKFAGDPRKFAILYKELPLT